MKMNTQKPNIIFINTDQHWGGALSCSGNKYINTPNLDKLASTGILFKKAYTSNPVCIPARFSMFTGRYPSEIEMESNADHRNNVPSYILENSMGNLLKSAGYETVYGGKIHLPGPSPVFEKVEPYGFTMRTFNYRDILADDCIEFLKQPHRSPFLMVASFVNPHDICYYAFNKYNLSVGKSVVGHGGTIEWDLCQQYLKELENLSEDELEEVLPKLPDNYEIPNDELSSVQMDKPDFYCDARINFNEKEWRKVRYLYKRFVERVDAKIGRLLDAINETGQEENTLIIYTSDHGEMNGSHHIDGKGYLYEEACNIPLIMSWKDVIPPGQVDDSHLVSLIDILPTMLDAAGVEIPQDLEGKSLLPLAQGNNPVWRKYLLTESNYSRLIHFGDWKYMVSSLRNIAPKPECETCDWTCHSNPVIREQITNLKIDKGETINFTQRPETEEIILSGRKIVKERYLKYKRDIDKTYCVEQ